MNSLMASLAVRPSRRHRSMKAAFASCESRTSIVSLFLGGLMEAMANSATLRLELTVNAGEMPLRDMNAQLKAVICLQDREEHMGLHRLFKTLTRVQCCQVELLSRCRFCCPQ